jgi:protoporphyrinogen oxidase
MYDMGNQPGGHTKTFEFDGGWTFDDGPHVSYTEEPRLQKLLSDNIGGDFNTVDTYVNNYWQGSWIKHPAQINLHGLPTDLVVECIEDFAKASLGSEPKIENYEDWLRAAFGDTFAETFPITYARKVHTTEAKNLTTDWLGPRLYRPELEEVLRGALTPSTHDVHYISGFRYPNRGGFVSFIRPFHEQANLQMNHKVEIIDPQKRLLTFESGKQVNYDHLVSSMPLPELIPRIKGAPREVLDAVDLLAASTIVMVNIGVNQSDISEATWTYFYDEDFSITRISHPHRMSSNTVPPGCGSIQAEIYFSKKYKPLTVAPESLIPTAVDDLRRCGLIRDDVEVLYTSAHVSKYAYIIWDHDRKPALDTVHGYLDELGIRYCGRFGNWNYEWTDEAFMSGEAAAQRVIDDL